MVDTLAAEAWIRRTCAVCTTYEIDYLKERILVKVHVELQHLSAEGSKVFGFGGHP